MNHEFASAGENDRTGRTGGGSGGWKVLLFLIAVAVVVVALG